MAFGMKYWMGAMAIGLTLVAVWRLPPATYQPSTEVGITHEEARLRALANDLRIAEATLKRIRWADSLSALVVAEGLEGVAFALPEGVDLTPEELAAAEARITLGVSGTSQAPNMALGFVYQPVSHGAAGGTHEDRRPRMETFVGTQAGVDYCVRVRVTEAERIADNIRYDLRFESRWASNTLGPCLYYARYGMPGDGITHWLESGGIQFGIGRSERPEAEPMRWRAGPFGQTYLTARDGVVLERCMAGVADSCAEVFLAPRQLSPQLAAEVEVARRSPAIATSDRRILRGEGSFLLADLEREFGPELFARFWTSQAPVDEAFHAAFGIEVGPWMVHWLATFTRISPPGPQMAQSTSSLGFLTVGLFVFLAFLRNRKRAVT